MLVVNSTIVIPDRELKFTFSRASGPGGQNVNKVSSKATLHFHAAASPSLPPAVKERLLAKYQSRLTTAGEFVIISQEHRDQPQNIESCRAKLRDMILSVAKAPKKRRATRPTRRIRRA